MSEARRKREQVEIDRINRKDERDRRVERHAQAQAVKSLLAQIQLVPLETLRSIVDSMDYEDRQAIRLAARAILDTRAWEGDPR